MIAQRYIWITALCIAWILPGLIGHDPWKPDEAYTFGVVYELLQGGSWVVPRLAGENFLAEPPLFHLSAAASAWLFSGLLPVHDAARLATGFYMALTFLFCGFAGRELHGPRDGVIAALLLLGCFGLVVRSHQLINDAASLTGFAIAYYGFALAVRRPVAAGFWIGTGIGLVFMTQGIFETLIAVLIAALLPLFGPWRNRGYAAAVAIALIAAAPWLLAWPLLLYRESSDLFAQWLWSENLSGLLTREVGGAGLLYYLRLLPWYAWPVWPIALWALWAARTRGYSRPAVALPVTGFVITLAALSSAPARELYALPLLIPLTLLATPASHSLRRGAAQAWYWFSVMAFAFFIVVLWFYWSGLELGIPARLHAHLHRLQPGYVPGFKWLPFTLAALYTLAWSGMVAGFKRSPQRPLIVWAAGLTTIWALLAILFIGWIDTGKSYRGVVASLSQALPDRYDCISSRELGEPQRAMLHYFGGIITYREEVPERRRNCRYMLVQGQPRAEVAPPGSWHKIWEGRRPGDKDEMYRLYQRRK